MHALNVMIVGPDTSLPGGIARYVESLTQYLQKASSIRPYLFNETEVKGCAGINGPSGIEVLRGSVRALMAVRCALRERRPDVVHLQSSNGRSLVEKTAMVGLASRLGIPTIVHMHGSSFEAELQRMGSMRRQWLGRVLGSPNHLVVLSESTRRLVARHLLPVRTTVLPNCVVPIDPPPGIQAAPVRFGFIGTLNPRKGICDLLEAMATSRNRTCELIVAGDGSSREKALAMAGELGIAGRVRFLGTVSGAKKERFFRDIDVLCLPSYAENLPISLLEAMAYGRPVVTTPVGSVPELVTDGVHGWLVPPGRVRSLSLAIDEAADNPQELRRRGLAAWERVAESYSWRTQGHRVVDLYRSLVGE